MTGEDAERDIERRNPDDIAESLRGIIHDATLLVCTGQYSPYPDHQRVMALIVQDQTSHKPVLIWDRFLRRSAITPFRDALRTYTRDVRSGAVDSMYATPWSYAWTTPPELLRVYDRTGLLVEVQNDVVQVRRGLSHLAVPLAEVAQVVGWLSSDWYTREVRIVLRGGERLVVAEVEEAMALEDPTYDGIDLMCDAAWVGRLGNAMAKGLGVPYVHDDPALT